MAKEVKRKSILVNEACLSEFNQLRKTLNVNSSEALQTLLQKEITRTETTMINRMEGD